jgi:hypothetical protein
MHVRFSNIGFLCLLGLLTATLPFCGSSGDGRSGRVTEGGASRVPAYPEVAGRSSSSRPISFTLAASAPESLRVRLHPLESVPASGAAEPVFVSPRVFSWQDSAEAVTQINAVAETQLTMLEENGYPLGSVEFHDFSGESVLFIDLAVDPGPLILLETLTFTGAPGVSEAFLTRVAGWRGREAYRTSRLERIGSAITGTGLFESVEGPLLVIDSLSTETAIGADIDTVLAGLQYRLRPAKVNRFDGLLGYSSNDQGLFGFVDLTLGNLFGSGRATHLFWQARENQETRFELEWHEPFIWRFPLALDLSLSHEMEDTLYAETVWKADLVWTPVPSLKARVGWGGSRLVLGGAATTHFNRQVSTFGVRRARPGVEPFRRHSGQRGWQADGEITNSRDRDFSLTQAKLRGREWFTWKALAILVEQEGAIVSDADSLLRSDAMTLGGGSSMRGFFEEAYRSDRYLLSSIEIGPRPGGGSRIYGFVDMALFRQWRQFEGSLYGLADRDSRLFAYGVGVETPSKAGMVKLDYAVPEGASVWRGRIHFGLDSRF